MPTSPEGVMGTKECISTEDSGHYESCSDEVTSADDEHDDGGCVEHSNVSIVTGHDPSQVVDEV